MSLKLDELRKRLLQQQSGTDGNKSDAASGAGGSATHSSFRSEGKVTAKAGPTPEPPVTTTSAEPEARNEDSSPASTPIDARASKPESEPIITRAHDPSPDPEPHTRAAETPPTDDRSDHAEAQASLAPGLDVSSANELGEAVAKVFEQAKALQGKLDDLARMFDPIERMGNSAARVFAPLRGFHQQLSQLARSFEPMRAFQTQLAQLAQTFEPMKALQDQMSLLAESFQEHLAELVKSLEPAKQFRDRIEQLAIAFDQANELQERFSELHDAFAAPAPLNGADLGARAAHDSAAH